MFLGPNPLSEKTIFTLMSLPKLNSIQVKPVPGFSPTEIPEMKNISQFGLYFDDLNAPSNSSCTAIVDILKKMPNLECLKLLKCRRSDTDKDQAIVYKQITNIIHNILKAFPDKRVVIINKLNITISSARKEGVYKTMIIDTRTGYDGARFLHDKSETLYLGVNYRDFEKFSNDLRLFLASENM